MGVAGLAIAFGVHARRLRSDRRRRGALQARRARRTRPQPGQLPRPDGPTTVPATDPATTPATTPPTTPVNTPTRRHRRRHRVPPHCGRHRRPRLRRRRLRPRRDRQHRRPRPRHPFRGFAATARPPPTTAPKGRDAAAHPATEPAPARTHAETSSTTAAPSARFELASAGEPEGGLESGPTLLPTLALVTLLGLLFAAGYWCYMTVIGRR